MEFGMPVPSQRIGSVQLIELLLEFRRKSSCPAKAKASIFYGCYFDIGERQPDLPLDFTGKRLDITGDASNNTTTFALCVFCLSRVILNINEGLSKTAAVKYAIQRNSPEMQVSFYF